MVLTANWVTKIITVPKSELALISGTRYSITVDYWFQLLRELNASIQGVIETVSIPLYENTSPTTTTPRITDVINGYTVVFEDGLYSVEFTDGNTNIREVEIKNQVSVGTNNTSALINPTVLEASVYAGQVIVDAVSGVAGTGKTPTGELIGTYRAPSNNETDAIAVAVMNGLKELIFTSNMALSEDYSNGYNIRCSSPLTTISVNPVANVSGASFSNATIDGELDGLNSVTNCIVNAITNVSGVMHQCTFASTIAMNGNLIVISSSSNVSGAAHPNFYGTAGATLEVRDFHGSLGMHGFVDGEHSIDGSGGRLIIHDDCTGGDIYVRGEWFDIRDESGAGCTVIDQRNNRVLAQDLPLIATAILDATT